MLNSGATGETYVACYTRDCETRVILDRTALLAAAWHLEQLDETAYRSLDEDTDQSIARVGHVVGRQRARITRNKRGY